jgi:uncharacterized protein (TIGR02118 family)
MASLIIYYGRPKDPAAFEDYYANRHLPFAGKTMPNVTGAETFRVLDSARAAGDDLDVYRVARMTYDSAESLRAGIESEDGQKVLADLDNFADGGYRALLCEEDEG